MIKNSHCNLIVYKWLNESPFPTTGSTYWKYTPLLILLQKSILLYISYKVKTHFDPTIDFVLFSFAALFIYFIYGFDSSKHPGPSKIATLFSGRRYLRLEQERFKLLHIIGLIGCTEDGITLGSFKNNYCRSLIFHKVWRFCFVVPPAPPLPTPESKKKDRDTCWNVISSGIWNMVVTIIGIPES